MKCITQYKLFWKSTLLVSLLVIIAACGSGANEQELMNSARGYIETGDLNAAALELKNVLSENANNAEARYLLGQIYLSLGDARSAEKELKRALGAGWEEAAVQLSLAESLFRQGKYQQVLDDIPAEEVYPADYRANLLAIRAAAEAGTGKMDKATETLSTSQSISPDALWVLHSSIKFQVNSEDFQAAEKTLAHALQVHPSSQDMWLLKAGLSEKKAKPSEVKAALQKVIDLEPPKNITVWGRQARLAQSQVYLIQQDYTEAKAVIDPILAKYPDDPPTNYMAGLIAFRQGQFDMTRERLQKVLKVAPEHSPTLLLLGMLNYAQNDYQQAAYNLEKVVAVQTNNVDAQILLGKTYLMLGQYQQAEDRFKLATAMVGENAELMALLGITRLRGGDTQAGLKDLEMAAEKAPADAGVRSELAKAYIETGDTLLAINLLESALEKTNGQHQAEALLILAYLRASEFDKAIDLARKLSAQFPDNPLPQIFIGMASEGKQDFATARSSYNKVLSFKPDDIQAILGHARLDMKEGNIAAARQRYQAVLALQPDHAGVLVSLAYLLDHEGDTDEALELLEKVSKADAELLEPRLILSDFYLRRGDAKEALEYAREAQRIDPKDRRVLLVLGKAQLGVGDPAAKQTIEELAEREPDIPESHYYLALVKVKAGDLQGARNSLHKVLKLNPDHNQSRLVLGNVELKAENTAAALEIARQLQKTIPDSAAGYLLEGDVMMARHESEKALSVYQLALSRAQNSEAVIKVNTVQQKLGNAKAGYDALLKWLEQHPDDLLVRFSLATTYMADGKNDAAKNQLRMIIKKQPDNAVALNDLAWLMHESSEQGAVEMAERAHRLAPDNAAIQDTYGWLLVQAGREEQGLIILEQAAQKAPDIYDIRYHLAMALAKVGDKTRAKQELKSILESGKSFSERDKAEALLQELQSETG